MTPKSVRERGESTIDPIRSEIEDFESFPCSSVSGDESIPISSADSPTNSIGALPRSRMPVS